MSKFNQDNCKRGHELHPLLMSGWTKYMKGERAVRAFLDKYTDERDAADLKDVQKKYGKALRYYHRKLMIDAKALIRVSDVPQPDPAVVRPALSTFTTTLDEATVIVDKEKKGKNSDALYQGGDEQLLTHAGWLQRLDPGSAPCRRQRRERSKSRRAYEQPPFRDEEPAHGLQWDGRAIEPDDVHQGDEVKRRVV